MSARGRRPGGEDTRATIVDAARSVFAQRGYEGASIRGIAREAGVDPKLVHHYFDGKSALFAEVLAFPVDPAVIVERLASVPQEQLGEALARAFLSVWDDPAGRERFAAMFAAAAASEEHARLVREFVGREIFVRLIARVQGEDPGGPAAAGGGAGSTVAAGVRGSAGSAGEAGGSAAGGAVGGAGSAALRAELGAAHLIGTGVLRYVVRLPSVANASVDELVTILGPSLQRHLLPDGPG